MRKPRTTPKARPAARPAGTACPHRHADNGARLGVCMLCYTAEQDRPSTPPADGRP